MNKQVDLLLKRYVAIAPDTSEKYEVGDIFIQYFFENSDTGLYTYVTNIDIPLQGTIIKKEYIEKLPHLFQEMPWWADRKPEDMPKYVKLVQMPLSGSYWELGAIMKVQNWVYDSITSHPCKYKCYVGNIHCYSAACLSPASEIEYQQFKSKK